MFRETIRPLPAEDQSNRTVEVLDTGSLLGSWRIHRNTIKQTESGADVYVVEFDSGGRHYRCPLYRFQAGTRLTEREAVERSLARGTMPA